MMIHYVSFYHLLSVLCTVHIQFMHCMQRGTLLQLKHHCQVNEWELWALVFEKLAVCGWNQGVCWNYFFISLSHQFLFLVDVLKNWEISCWNYWYKGKIDQWLPWHLASTPSQSIYHLKHNTLSVQGFLISLFVANVNPCCHSYPVLHNNKTFVWYLPGCWYEHLENM